MIDCYYKLGLEFTFFLCPIRIFNVPEMSTVRLSRLYHTNLSHSPSCGYYMHNLKSDRLVPHSHSDLAT